MQISWFKTFGFLMGEAGIVILLSFAMQQGVYVVADIIRGDTTGPGPILDSFAHSRTLLGTCELTMGSVLLLLEALYLPLLSRKQKTG